MHWQRWRVGRHLQEHFIVDSNFILLIRKTVAVDLNYLNKG